MLARAWYLIAVPWTLLNLWSWSSQREPWGPLHYLIIFGPLFLPWALKVILGWVLHGMRYFTLVKTDAPPPLRRQRP